MGEDDETSKKKEPRAASDKPFQAREVPQTEPPRMRPVMANEQKPPPSTEKASSHRLRTSRNAISRGRVDEPDSPVSKGQRSGTKIMGSKRFNKGGTKDASRELSMAPAVAGGEDPRPLDSALVMKEGKAEKLSMAPAVEGGQFRPHPLQTEDAVFLEENVRRPGAVSVQPGICDEDEDLLPFDTVLDMKESKVGKLSMAPAVADGQFGHGASLEVGTVPMVREAERSGRPGAVSVPGIGLDSGEYDHETVVAHTVDEEAMERQILQQQSEEIRNRIIGEAVVATTVLPEEEEKHLTFSQRYKVPILLIVVIVVILAVVLGLTLSGGDGTSDPTLLDQPTGEPSTAPSSFPSLSEFESMVQLLSTVSSREALLNENSTQNQALRWLYEEDLFDTPTIPSDLINRYVVALLYFSTGGDTWFDRLGFLSNSSVCQWQKEEGTENSNGVRCNSQAEIVQVRLDDNNLNGTLPDEILSWKSLEVLALGTNSLRGTIPPTIGVLSRLERLELFENEITGPLPDSVVELTNLETLSLYDNNMTGTLPSLLLKIQSLARVLIHENSFVGTIPDSYTRSGLRALRLRKNQLNGTIPASIYTLQALTALDLHSNRLIGTISTLIGDLISLRQISLHSQGLSGTIPAEIGFLSDNLEDVALSSTLLTGTIPWQIGLLENLQRLNLHDMRLTGEIPSTLGLITSLVHISLQGNDLQGEVPTEMGQLGMIPDVGIDLSNNSLTGSLNETFCGGIPPNFLGADCDEIDCPCCSHCCSDATGTCEANLELICEGKKLLNENCSSCVSLGTECDCLEGGAKLSCTDTCEACNFDQTICTKNFDYGNTLQEETGVDNIFRCNLRYTKGREGNFSVVYDFIANECSAWLDGVSCNACAFGFLCDDGSLGIRFDCTNVQQDAFLDVCEGNNDGTSWLPIVELHQTGCPPCL